MINNSELFSKPFQWLVEGSSQDTAIVAGSLTLLRNLEGFPFPHAANDEVLEMIHDKISSTLDKFPQLSSWSVLKPETATLEEWHIACHQINIPFEVYPYKRHNELRISPDQEFSLVINGEEHLTINSVFSGNLQDSYWKTIDMIDTALSSELTLAYSHDYGFCTSQVENIGTGLIASQVLCLAGLELTMQLPQVINAVNALGFQLEPLFGHAKQGGSYYILSNRHGLGIRENDIVEKVRDAALDLEAKELEARDVLLCEDPYSLVHRVSTSYGYLKHSFCLDEQEAQIHLSNLLMGIDFNLFESLSSEKLCELIGKTVTAGIDLDGDFKKTAHCRAEIIRNCLKNP